MTPEGVEVVVDVGPVGVFVAVGALVGAPDVPLTVRSSA